MSTRAVRPRGLNLSAFQHVLGTQLRVVGLYANSALVVVEEPEAMRSVRRKLRKLVAFSNRRRCLIVAIATVVMLRVAANYVSPARDQHGM